MRIRDAEAADLATITTIYNHAVENTTAIWNEDTVDIEDRAAWLRTRTEQGFPVLVAVDGSGVLGYATFGAWRPHTGYRHTVELSVYVHPDRHGRGIGGELMTALIERARTLGKHVMVAAVESGNSASIRLHEKHGFVRTGLLPQVGMKFGAWLDLAFLQLVLDERSAPPA
ncbi:GNAT family N-acetyltransferase [Microbacterium sp. NPDC056234]|uniref:GNAT family N-acetyltransferase n=1 Tax=Microbacterium sp. NPDC056234 TaxID=3345757 RepID=UPI0035DED226